MNATVRNHAFRIDIAAEPERVWDAFVDPAALRRWCVKTTRIRPGEGGSLALELPRGVEIDTHIDVFLPGERLRLIHLPPPRLPPSEAVVVDEFLFETGELGTTLRFLSTGVPPEPSWDEYYLRQRRHWQLALARLKVFIEKGMDRKEVRP